MGQLNLLQTIFSDLWDLSTSFDLTKFHWNPSACGRDFDRNVVLKSHDFGGKILLFEDSWNHRRVTPGSLLGAPRSPSRLVDLSKLFKSPRISNHEKRRFNVTSDPLLTSFSKMSLCWLHNGQIWDFQSIILLILLGQRRLNMVRSTLRYSPKAKMSARQNHSNTGHFQHPLSWVN